MDQQSEKHAIATAFLLPLIGLIGACVVYMLSLASLGQSVEATVSMTEEGCYTSTASGECLRSGYFTYYNFEIGDVNQTDVMRGYAKEGSKVEVIVLPFAPVVNIVAENGRFERMTALVLVLFVVLLFAVRIVEKKHKRKTAFRDASPIKSLGEY